MKPVYAYWSIELNCQCPDCGEIIDLMDLPEDYNFDIGEHDTETSKNVTVECECGKDFKVDLAW